MPGEEILGVFISGGMHTRTKQSWKCIRRSPGAFALLELIAEVTTDVIRFSAFGHP
jgi:hypothetical protein